MKYAVAREGKSSLNLGEKFMEINTLQGYVLELGMYILGVGYVLE